MIIRSKCYNLALQTHYKQKQSNWITIVYHWTVLHSGIFYICRPILIDCNFKNLKLNTKFADEYKINTNHLFNIYTYMFKVFFKNVLDLIILGKHTHFYMKPSTGHQPMYLVFWEDHFIERKPFKSLSLLSDILTCAILICVNFSNFIHVRLQYSLTRFFWIFPARRA